MRSKEIVLAATAWILLCPPAMAAQEAPPAGSVPQEALPSVVTIRAYGATGEQIRLGSGFFLSDGRVVTNSHVVAGAEWVEIMDQEENLLGTAPYAEVLSTRSDLAVLPELSSGQPGLPVSGKTPRPGDEVWVIGSPEGLHGSVSNGVVSAVRSLDGQRYLQVSAPVSSGSSGGPILNAEGEVVGVVVSFVTDGQNLNFGVPADQVRALTNSPPGEYSFQHVAAADGRGRSSTGDGPVPAERFGTAMENAPVLDLPGYETGQLAPSDLDGDGRYMDLYRFSAERGQTLTLYMASDEFDTGLAIVGLGATEGEDRWMRIDDDGGEGTNSRLMVTVPESGEYVVLATSYSEEAVGEYAIAVLEGTPSDWEEGSESVSEASDERWMYVGLSNDSTRWYVDLRSVNELGAGRVRVWTRMEYREGTAEYDEATFRWDLDCQNRRYRGRSYFYYEDGRLVDDGTMSDPSWSDVPPETIGETVLATACEER